MATEPSQRPASDPRQVVRRRPDHVRAADFDEEPADRLGTPSGALHKTLPDGRRKLRADLEARGFAVGAQGREER
jgi:hypothetical protein